MQDRIKNMSAGGAFIRSDQILPPAERLRLVIHFRGVSPFNLTAEVVWCRDPDNGQPAGMDVMFTC
jgi:hypothetical protein